MDIILEELTLIQEKANKRSDTKGPIALDLKNVEDIPVDPDKIPKGDMPGDKIQISDDHIKKARFIFPKLAELLLPLLNSHPHQRAVIAVCGGSGVGKSETASLLSYFLNSQNIGSYTLSGDNYPHRIPMYNDAERLRVFRTHGLKGLIAHGIYDSSIQGVLDGLWSDGNDSNLELTKEYPWLAKYQEVGRSGLRNYLGTANEIDFDELNGIISQFKSGADTLYLKRMGREANELWYEAVEFDDKHVLIIEWTHGNSFHLRGVDIPILLNSTPEETLEHRKKRNRDGGTDSPFTTMVLSIEQELLNSQAQKAKLIVSKDCELLTYDAFKRVMLK
jgi:hypothetical protein